MGSGKWVCLPEGKTIASRYGDNKLMGFHQAYLEFFVAPLQLNMLIEHISRDQNITYYAINKHGDLRTNNSSEGPNAVTWGIFPGKEVIQPTIVEAVSFMAWKVTCFTAIQRTSPSLK